MPPHVGKYSSPMEHLGDNQHLSLVNMSFHRDLHRWSANELAICKLHIFGIGESTPHVLGGWHLRKTVSQCDSGNSVCK